MYSMNHVTGHGEQPRRLGVAGPQKQAPPSLMNRPALAKLTLRGCPPGHFEWQLQGSYVLLPHNICACGCAAWRAAPPDFAAGRLGRHLGHLPRNPSFIVLKLATKI